MIHVSEPVLNGNERKYVLECLDNNQLSMGPMAARFEQALAEYVGTKYAFAVSSGTAALHLALMALGIGPGDEVIVPALTFVATANAVTYCGAQPVLVDVDPETWCMDPALVKRSLSDHTKAVLPVHLFGHPADVANLPFLMPTIEDAAEALGAQADTGYDYDLGYNKFPLIDNVGTLGDLACFSFYGNKLVTCGEGGAVTTNDNDLAARVRLLRGQGQGNRRYYHEVIGYNYRMTDLQAAIGLGQLENIEWHLQRRAEVAAWYREYLPANVTTQKVASWAKPAHWLTAVLLPENRCPGCVAEEMVAAGIETRPIFTPLHLLPMYQDGISRPVAEDVAKRGICLPTHANLSEADVRAVCAALGEALGV